MKRALILASLLLTARASAPLAQVFYQYPSAPTIEPQQFVVGSYMSGGDDLFRWGAYGRVGLGRYWDFGIEGVAENLSGDWRVGAAGDVKYRILAESKAIPFDLSVDVGFGFAGDSGLTVFHLPVGGVLSVPLAMGDGTRLTPYVGVYAIYVRSEFKAAGLPDVAQDDVEALLRGGVSVEIRKALELFGTLQLGPEDLASVGINYRL